MSNQIRYQKHEDDSKPTPYVRSRTFCCCLPVRFGVFFLSIIGTLGAGFIAAVAWFQVKQLNAHPLSPEDRAALLFHTSVYTILAATSFLGFIGAIFKLRRLMIVYWVVLTIVLLISIASGAYTLYSIFARNSTESIVNCLDGATDDLTLQVCQNGIAIIKWVAVAVYIVTWLLEIYAIFIVYQYAEQLRDEQIAAEKVAVSTSMISNPAPLMMYNSAGAVGHNTGYAFSKVNNSFGTEAQRLERAERRANLTSIV